MVGAQPAMKPTPILFTIPNFITAGSGQAMLNIIQRLDRERFAPAVCVMKKGGELDREVEQMGIPFIEAPFTVPARPYHRLLPRAWKASQAFRPYRFALWHSFHYTDDYTEPVIARLAGARAWVYTKKNMSWHRRAWTLRTWLAASVAAQNQDMLREFFAAPWFRRKAWLIPRGVDTTRFRPAAPANLRLRERLGIAPGEVVAACVAHLVPVKGHPTLLQALAQTTGLHLWIAGKALDEDYAARLHQMAAELRLEGRVHFLGGVGDVPALLAEADIFVLPTWGRWREGCPVALLEAMACGKACVATDVSGSRDLVFHQQSGLLVPPEDPAALSAALSALAQDPALRQGFGQAARRRVEERYTIEREVADHQALYQEILGRD
jgi:glycosyltransferase involved in cell wall biosynthesis